MDPILLNIETAAKTCSVALSRGADLLAEAENHEGEHTRVLNQLIRDVFEKAKLGLQQLDAIAVNEGPGSYTSLRVGVVTAKGMAYALDKPLIMVSGLKCLAAKAMASKPGVSLYASMMDARRDEVFMAIYDQDLQELLCPQAVILDNIWSQNTGFNHKKMIITGDGASKWHQFISNWPVEHLENKTRAGDMVPVSYSMFINAKFTDFVSAKPFYIKPPNITIPKDKLLTN